MNTQGIARSTLFGATALLGGYLYSGLRTGLWALFVWLGLICLLELRRAWDEYRRGW